MSVKILVVDDSLTMRRINIKSLKKLGFEDIDEAENGMVALDAAQKNDYQLILLDINMPIMNGFECLDALKKSEQTRDVPVIIVTSESNK